MSMHRIPLTDIEREGLKAHGLGRNIGKPSQLADCFRQGVKWGQGQERSRLHAENTALQSGYDAARLEIASLRERVQMLGPLARDVNSRRVVELEAQLAAVGAGGVDPLRKRCLHPISEPVQPLVCDYCGALTPDPWHSSGMLHGKMSKHIHSCDACAARGATQASPVDANVQAAVPSDLMTFTSSTQPALPQAHHEEQPDGTTIPIDPSEMAPQQPAPAPMSPANRLVAYSAAARNQWGVARKPAGKRPVDPLVGLRLLDNARPFDEGDNLEQHIKTRAAFARLRDGSADNNDFDRVALAINLAKVRALEIDNTLAGMLTDAQNAMTALRKRKVRWGKWDMLDTEAALVVEALDATEAIVDASSPLQMHLAALEVRRSILANIAAKKAQKETQ